MTINKSFKLFFLFFSMFIANAHAQIIGADVFGSLPTKSMFAISPSGQFIAYRDTTNNGDAVLIVNAADFSLVKAVDVSSVNPNSMFFVDEDKLIMVITKNKRILGYRGRHEVSAAFTYNISTSKLFQLLVQGQGGLTAGQTSLGRIIAISQDKKSAYMPAYDEDSKLNLYRVSLEKKGRPRRVKKGTPDTINYFMGDNDEVIARERFNNKYNRHSVESNLSGKWKEVFVDETPYIDKGFTGVTPDKANLVMSEEGKNGLRSYYSLSLKDGSVTQRLFSHDNKGVERPITDINRVIHGVEYSGFTPTYEFFDNKLNARLAGISKALPEYTPRIVDFTKNWDNIIFYADGIENPGMYMMYKSGGLSLLTLTRPEILPETVGDITEYTYNARDGVRIPTLLTYPKGKEAKNLPAIMMPHGGPESYDKKHFDYLAQYFANRGYLVIQPQFRGSTGFGAEHTLIGRGEWGRKMQDDLTDGVKHLADTGLIDPSKVCIVGASYGGYAALAGAVFTPDLYQCVISINGVSDLPEMMSSERAQYGRNHWVIKYWDDVISGGDFDKNHLKQISPINHVEKVKAPVLLIHGEYDKVVPWSQSDDMYDELRSADKDVSFVKLLKGDHYLSTSENRIKAMEAIEAFMKKHM